MSERARDIAHGSPGHHRAEGADLDHMIAPVFLTCVFDEFVAAVVGDVHVDIGR